MKKRKQRKPTMNQVEVVVGNLIKEAQNQRASLEMTQRVLSSYIEFNKHESKFKKFIEEKNGKENNTNNRASSEKK